MLFEEEKCWDWRTNNSFEQILIILLGILSPNFGSFSTHVSNNVSANINITENIAQDSSSSEESPPIRVRTLKEIYESCSFALNVSDPTTIEEVQKFPKWKHAIQEELNAI